MRRSNAATLRKPSGGIGNTAVAPGDWVDLVSLLPLVTRLLGLGLLAERPVLGMLQSRKTGPTMVIPRTLGRKHRATLGAWLGRHLTSSAFVGRIEQGSSCAHVFNFLAPSVFCMMTLMTKVTSLVPQGLKRHHFEKRVMTRVMTAVVLFSRCHHFCHHFIAGFPRSDDSKTLAFPYGYNALSSVSSVSSLCGDTPPSRYRRANFKIHTRPPFGTRLSVVYRFSPRWT
jgi:hypothetical protein